MRGTSSAAALVCILTFASAARAVPIEIHYADPDGHGFFDPVLGEARRAALEYATDLWAATLDGTVPVLVYTQMNSAGGTATGALLASAGPVTVHRNFGELLSDTWYPAALANQLVGGDINGSNAAEIEIRFNVDVDRDDVLGSTRFYYGLDANPGSDVDFVTIALHEIGHGLGFLSSISGANGAFLYAQDQPGPFERNLVWPGVGRFAELLRGERLAAARSGELLWDGPSVVAFHGRGGAVFAPEAFVQGSSVGHWDPANAPGELMAPRFEGAQHDFGMLLPALVDIGWQMRGDAPTPRATTAPPTPTPTATATRFPVATPATVAGERIYVANFADHTVSVLDAGFFPNRRDVRVGRGPAGLAASPDGRRVYVANFHDGTVSILSTRLERPVRTISVGDAAYGVAVSLDGTTVAVTDTYRDELILFDADTGAVRTRLPTGRAPNGIAIGPNNWAYVAQYGEAEILVVDMATGKRRALIATAQPYLISIAAAPTGRIVAVGFRSGSRNRVSLWEHEQIARLGASIGPNDLAAVTFNSDGSRTFVAGSDENRSNLVILAGDSGTQLGITGAGLAPEALAVSPDDRFVYVTNMGDDSLWTFNAVSMSRTNQVAVGRSPMAVSAIAVPQLCDGDCDGDGTVSVDELIRAVSLGLGEVPLWHCRAADANDDGRLTVDEILTATQRALRGCGLGGQSG